MIKRSFLVSRILVACVGLALAAPALASIPSGPAPMKWDEQTGRSKLNYPPSRAFALTHVKLEMSIADMDTPAFDGVATLTLKAMGRERDVVQLDARQTMTITKVTFNGVDVGFVHVHDKLTIVPPTPVAAEQPATVVIHYRAENPSKDGTGLVWMKTRKREGRPDQPAQIFSQGEANWNSFWIPLHDQPGERLSSEIIVELPAGYRVVSNGVLRERATIANGRERWWWSQSRPHAPYLIMLAVSKWDTIELGGAGSARPNLPMTVYGPLGSAARLQTIYKRTPEMVALFERLLDEPYPWDKYDQIIVRGFRWGGMENTSATILAEYASRGPEGSSDDLIAHELMHQWMGDLLTCRTWEHIWLNEGWATLGEWLWVEHAKGDRAYLREVRTARNKLTVLPLEPAPAGIAMASKVFTDADEVFDKPEDPYVRGGLVLHALRERLGEDAFWAGTRAYIDRHKDTAVETADFRLALESASGESLERFFDEFVYRPGVPSLTVTCSWDEQKKAVLARVEQTQAMSAEAPAYEVWVPMKIIAEDGRVIERRVHCDAREATEEISLDAPPRRVVVDPRCEVIAKLTVKLETGAPVDEPAEPKPEPETKPAPAQPEDAGDEDASVAR